MSLFGSAGADEIFDVYTSGWRSDDFGFWFQQFFLKQNLRFYFWVHGAYDGDHHIYNQAVVCWISHIDHIYVFPCRGVDFYGHFCMFDKIIQTNALPPRSAGDVENVPFLRKTDR